MLQLMVRGGWCSFGRPSTSHHTYTRTQPHVTAGGGRGKLSTLFRNEATDAQQAPGLSLGSMVVVVAGYVVALTTVGALVWQVSERRHQEEVARITGEVEAELAQAKAEMARLQDEAKVELARITAEAEADVARAKAEAVRIIGEAKDKGVDCETLFAGLWDARGRQQK